MMGICNLLVLGVQWQWQQVAGILLSCMLLEAPDTGSWMRWPWADPARFFLCTPFIFMGFGFHAVGPFLCSEQATEMLSALLLNDCLKKAREEWIHKILVFL